MIRRSNQNTCRISRRKKTGSFEKDPKRQGYIRTLVQTVENSYITLIPIRFVYLVKPTKILVVNQRRRLGHLRRIRRGKGGNLVLTVGNHFAKGGK